MFRKKDPDASEFWKKREEEIGSPVLARTLGRVLNTESDRPLWAIFYTCEHSVFYQTFQTVNWMSMLFSGGKSRGSGKDEIIAIPGAALRHFGVREKKKSWSGFLDKSSIVEISWDDQESGEVRELVFEMDGNAREFVDSFPAR